MLKTFLKLLCTLMFRVRVTGLEYYHAAGERVLIVANHQSFLDAMLLALFLPEKPMFAINRHIADRWYVKPFMSLVRAFPLDPTSPMATKAMIHEIRKDRKCVIFPEGRITVTGSLMKIYDGSGLIADKSGATILPVHIDGAQYSLFSRLRGKVRTRLFPKISLTICKPQPFSLNDTLRGRARRRAAGNALYDMMSAMMYECAPKHHTLTQSLFQQAATHGMRHIVAEDPQRKPMSYGSLIVKSTALGACLRTMTDKEATIGVMLPNMCVTFVTFFAVHAFGRVPAMLNFSLGAHGLKSICRTAAIRQVITSRNFIEKARLADSIAALERENIRIIYLEDLATEVSARHKLLGLAARFVPWLVKPLLCRVKPDDTAVILFTSGSEGEPKAVLLSHKNIQCNRAQLAARIDFGPQDIVFNALPMFHAFGLTGGTLLPVLSGIRTFFYPSPLHYRLIPELIYDVNATIMFGTDTFLAGYARFAHAYDFYSVRYVFAGAEKLRDETRAMWADKYGVRIFEGYGTTETAPGITINTPMYNKPGSVGRFLPGIDATLQPVDGIDEGGRLIVCGDNVMKGYYLPDNPAVIAPPEKNCHDTGDIVTVDDEGYVFITGRAKRFAKIAGEMVSLAAVERYLNVLWPDYQHGVVIVPDKQKGEALVLITERPDAKRADISRYVKENKLNELTVPRHIISVEALPLLATGKRDYASLQTIADENV